jgi:predicted ATPase
VRLGSVAHEGRRVSAGRGWLRGRQPWRELFAADSERRHDFDAAVAEYDGLARSYPAHGHEVVVLPRASVAARADFLEAALAGI